MAYDKSVPFSFLKDGVFYFERRIPRDVQHHYDTQKIAYSLRTRSATVAASRARRAADQLDEYWYHLRIKDTALPGKHRLRIAASNQSHPPTKPLQETVKLSEAVGIYLKLKGKVDLPCFCGELLAYFPGLSLEGDWALEAER